MVDCFCQSRTVQLCIIGASLGGVQLTASRLSLRSKRYVLVERRPNALPFIRLERVQESAVI